jgi:CheY-like chemotaxis protein
MSKTILCADDSATMQKVAAVTFAASDFKYVGARTVDEALQLAQSEKPALILADAIMAGKNGYDLCRAVKSDAQLAGIPVLLMCGNSQSYDGTRGETAGADGFVTKPWDTQVMLDKVAETLTRVASEGAARLGQGVAGGQAASSSGNTRSNRAPTPQPVSTAPFPAQSRAPSAQSRAPSAPLGAPTSGPTSPRASSQATAVSSGPGAQVSPGMPQPPRSATIMGMPTFPMPPATEAAAVAPMSSAPASAPTAAPQVRATGSASDTSPNLRPPMIKGTPQRRLRLVPISEMAAQVASEHGLDPEGPEMQALLKLSREVVERIVWEVVPDLAEAIIKQNLDRLTARAR